MLDRTEIILRLGVATLAGGTIGLNRDLHGKPIGLKTLSLVSLATAMLLVMVHSDDVKIVSDAGSRVIQGILTGIGFLGAGVIVPQLQPSSQVRQIPLPDFPALRVGVVWSGDGSPLVRRLVEAFQGYVQTLLRPSA